MCGTSKDAYILLKDEMVSAIFSQRKFNFIEKFIAIFNVMFTSFPYNCLNFVIFCKMISVAYNICIVCI